MYLDDEDNEDADLVLDADDDDGADIDLDAIIRWSQPCRAALVCDEASHWFLAYDTEFACQYLLGLVPCKSSLTAAVDVAPLPIMVRNKINHNDDTSQHRD